MSKAKETKIKRIARISRKYAPELKFSDVVKQRTNLNHVIENPPQTTNSALRSNQNLITTDITPLLNIINVIEEFQRIIHKILNEQQMQLSEIKKSLSTHEER